MTYTAGVVFVSIAAVLLGVFSRKMFFGDGSASLMDFSELYYWGQWTGFWCTVLSLFLFTLAARSAPFPLISRRALPVAVAIALCLSFLVFSIPEWSNKHGWRRGAIGGKIYVETKIKLWQERQEEKAREAISRNAFEGAWRTAEGTSLEIRPRKILLGTTEFSTATCAGGEFHFVMTSRVGVGAHFYRAGLVMSPQYKSLPEGQYPLLTYACDGREAAFMVIAPRQLVAVLDDDTAMTFTK